MSTGRICPCIKDNKENIARQSVWQNAGEWNRQGAAFAKKMIMVQMGSTEKFMVCFGFVKSKPKLNINFSVSPVQIKCCWCNIFKV